jgi:hypothetical protein
MEILHSDIPGFIQKARSPQTLGYLLKQIDVLPESVYLPQARLMKKKRGSKQSGISGLHQKIAPKNVTKNCKKKIAKKSDCTKNLAIAQKIWPGDSRC